ncbi:MAG: hypothetical protein PHW50_03340, partial [Patescibacteria group bacterium]|nr:hypothetical protein [Patescibacteria group bacterium]
AVSWETDEPATSFVEYAEGLNGNQYTNKTVEDKALTTKHLVVISELIPSKPYHLRVVSADKANNIGRSEDSTAITGEVPKSVLQLILKTLGNTFGWLSKFMGLGL